MSCIPFRTDGPNGPFVGVFCGPRRRVAPCAFCHKAHTQLCDYPTSKGKTCDRKLCADHRTAVEPGQDYCPEHAKQPSVPTSSLSSQMALLEGK